MFAPPTVNGHTSGERQLWLFGGQQINFVAPRAGKHIRRALQNHAHQAGPRTLSRETRTLVPSALSWMRGPVGAGGRAGGAPVLSGITLARIVSSSTHVYLQKPKRVN